MRSYSIVFALGALLTAAQVKALVFLPEDVLEADGSVAHLNFPSIRQDKLIHDCQFSCEASWWFNSTLQSDTSSRYDVFEFLRVAQANNNNTNSNEENLRSQVRALYEQFLSYSDLILEQSNTARLEIPGYKQSIEFIQYSRTKAAEALEYQDYASVNRIIVAALREVEIANEIEEKQFELYFHAAQQAYFNAQPEQALESIAWAQRLRPGDSGVLQWRQWIDELPMLIAAREQAANARRSGDFKIELDALNQILVLLPQDDASLHEIAEVQQRIKAIQRELQDNHFASVISQGKQAVAQHNLDSAKQALEKVKSLRPSATETKTLQQQVSALESQISKKNLLEAATQHADKDDWVKTVSILDQILAIDPHHVQASEQRKVAVKIVEHQRMADQFLAQPDRLASANIAAAARELIATANQLTLFSKRLNDSVAELSSMVVSLNTPVRIHIISDGETDISVRGVGVVGKTTGRTIELKPGRYIFEGARKGYRSVLVNVSIDHKDPQEPEITVICHERI